MGEGVLDVGDAEVGGFEFGLKAMDVLLCVLGASGESGEVASRLPARGRRLVLRLEELPVESLHPRLGDGEVRTKLLDGAELLREILDLRLLLCDPSLECSRLLERSDRRILRRLAKRFELGSDEAKVVLEDDEAGESGLELVDLSSKMVNLLLEVAARLSRLRKSVLQ